MLGEALEDLESCGQSELLRELEVLSPGQRACEGSMSRHTGGLGKVTHQWGHACVSPGDL